MLWCRQLTERVTGRRYNLSHRDFVTSALGQSFENGTSTIGLSGCSCGNKRKIDGPSACFTSMGFVFLCYIADLSEQAAVSSDGL